MILNNSKLIRSQEKIFFQVNDVIKKTFLLLSLTIFFSSIFAFFSVKYSFSGLNILYFIILYFFILYLINLFKNTKFSLFFVFIFSGFMGLNLGPILNNIFYSKHGTEIVFYSLFFTGINFIICSFYILYTKKNLSFLNNFLYTGFFAVFFIFILSFFYKHLILNLIISSFISILSSLTISSVISDIINNGEDDYISATISIYLSLYNIFISLLNLFSFFFNKE